LDLLVFDPETERSLRHIRQVRRRIQFENSQYSQIEEAFSESDSAYSSAFEIDFELPSSDLGTSTMGDFPRITLKQMDGASMALENQPVRFPELNENFELKSGLINLLPRFHGMPEGRAKDWYHTLSGEVTAEWWVLREDSLKSTFRHQEQMPS
ncbi:hypothetical protein PIB30_059639, partial [Stylosanthes scabra]|nr:hypothetical protein [Stylosanthes scabra]